MCDYEAEDKYDLDAHTWHDHEEEMDETIGCNSCDKTVSSLGQLMQHKKKKHSDKVSSCWKFSEGCCPFGEERCWFLHNNKENDFKCSICDKTFNTQKYLMIHRKSEHADTIQKCKNDGSCLFKNDCWYKHDKIDDNGHENNDKNENVIQKLFEVVEKNLKKLTRLESMSQKNNQWKRIN